MAPRIVSSAPPAQTLDNTEIALSCLFLLWIIGVARSLARAAGDVTKLKIIRVEEAATEYGFRFSGEERFKDGKWRLGFKQARVSEIQAWSRLLMLFAIALLALATLGTSLLLFGGAALRALLRRVASRRRGRCELGLIAATLGLIQQDRGLRACLLPFTKFKLESTLHKMSRYQL